jgi:hypothetical protein
MKAEKSEVRSGKRYDTSKATCIADNEYWDGSNFERHGRNTHLYRTNNGAYFAVHSTQWQGEQNTLEVLSEEEARALYESLSEHNVEWEQAFPGTQIEEA